MSWLYKDSKSFLATSVVVSSSYITPVTFPGPKPVKPPKSEVIQNVFNKSSFQYISSGSDSEVLDDSEFLKNLVIGLSENTNKYLSASVLYHQFLRQSYTSANGQTVIPQMSTINGCGHELGGDFFFIKKDK